jgi:hypothetical protein
VHGRKLELEHFLSQHCVDICLLSETFLKPGQAACFGGGLPVLMAGDLNAKHVDWNSRLTTDGENSYVITLARTPV